MKKNHLILSLSVCIAMLGLNAFAKSSPELVKQEEGFYYGYGTGSTAEEAASEAKRDLVSYALTTTLRATNPKAASIEVSDESINARLGNIKPYVESKSGSSPSVTYRMKIVDWSKKEKAYQETLRAELTPRYTSLASKKNPADKSTAALAILSRLAAEGETDLLTVQEEATELLARKVELVCSEIAKSLVIEISAKDGFISPDTQFSVKVTDSSKKAVSGIALAAVWEIPSLPTNDASVEIAEVRSFIKSDSLGNATIDYPVSEDYHNKPVTLTVSTSFAQSVPSSVELKKIDAQDSIDACYVHFDDLAKAFPSVEVPAGEFNAGAVEQDNRATKKEASHKVTTEAFAIDVAPVTNAQYASFLHATRAAEMPEYFYNDDYNKGNQPVVGVTVENAEAYAAWLSEQTGCTYRLPTEEEWEKAARAGKDIIYPWGDDSPAKAKNANYKGNGSFKAPSPIGSFQNGSNEWGLVDMAGNVWEWTSTTNDKDAGSTFRTVKGGSWMDGPNDLRISNFRNIDGQQGYADTGFRLVKEINNNNNSEVSK